MKHKREWGLAEQAIYNGLACALFGLRRLDWINYKEQERILNIVQKAIDRGMK